MPNAATLDEAYLIEGYLAEMSQRGTSSVAERRQDVTAHGGSPRREPEQPPSSRRFDARRTRRTTGRRPDDGPGGSARHDDAERPRGRRGEGRTGRGRSQRAVTSARWSTTEESAASSSTSTRRPTATRLLDAGRHRRRAGRELLARIPRRARPRPRRRRVRTAVARLLLAHRLPAHDPRRRSARHRPARAGPFGHAVRATRLPRRPDLPARAPAEHRGVVPRRWRGSSPRCTSARSPAAGSGWRPRCIRACSRSPRSCGRTSSTGSSRGSRSGSSPRPSIYECADGLWVHSMHFAGGRGKDRSVVWRDPRHRPARPRVEPDRWPGVRGRWSRDAIGRMKRQDLLDQFWANEIADRAGPARARGARGRAGDQQRHVGRGRRPACTVPSGRPASRSGSTARRTPGVQGPQPARRSTHRRGARRRSPTNRRAHVTVRPGEARRSRTRWRASRSSTSATSSPARSVRCCSATSARPCTSWSPRRATRCARSRSRSTAASAGSSTSSSTSRAPEGLEIAHRLIREVDVVHHNMRPGVAERLGVDYETAQAAQPDRDLLPHDDVGQRRPARDVAGVRPARAVVVRARAGAGRRGQRTQLVPLRHVRPGLRGAVGARGAHGALLARAHRRRPARRHVDRERRRAPQHRRVDRTRRAGRSGPAPTSSRPASVRCTASIRRATAGSRWRAWAIALDRARPGGARPRRPVASPPPSATCSSLPRSLARAERVRRARRRPAYRSRSPTRTRGRTWFAQPDLIAAGLVADYEHPTYGRFRQFGHLVNLSETPGSHRRATARCSASTPARCSPSSATRPKRSRRCASAASPSGPTDAGVAQSRTGVRRARLSRHFDAGSF